MPAVLPASVSDGNWLRLTGRPRANDDARTRGDRDRRGHSRRRADERRKAHRFGRHRHPHGGHGIDGNGALHQAPHRIGSRFEIGNHRHNGIEPLSKIGDLSVHDLTK
jgi:hypothetical protein